MKLAYEFAVYHLLPSNWLCAWCMYMHSVVNTSSLTLLPLRGWLPCFMPSFPWNECVYKDSCCRLSVHDVKPVLLIDLFWCPHAGRSPQHKLEAGVKITAYLACRAFSSITGVFVQSIMALFKLQSESSSSLLKLVEWHLLTKVSFSAVLGVAFSGEWHKGIDASRIWYGWQDMPGIKTSARIKNSWKLCNFCWNAKYFLVVLCNPCSDSPKGWITRDMCWVIFWGK